MPEGEIRGRLEGGQLHRLWAGVYAVGRPDLGRLGRFKAATLVCGDGAQLSHGSAADLWRIRQQAGGLIDIAVPSASFPRRRGIRLHRRANLGPPKFVRGIPVADPVSVLIDLAAELATEEVEDAVNEADRLDLIRTARHHRTAAEQAVDLGRDQAHARAGIRSLRFTHSQVFHRPDHVREVLIDAFHHLHDQRPLSRPR
jgi:hypothetical protein